MENMELNLQYEMNNYYCFQFINGRKYQDWSQKDESFVSFGIS